MSKELKRPRVRDFKHLNFGIEGDYSDLLKYSNSQDKYIDQLESKLKAVEENDYILVRGYISWRDKKWNTPNPNPQLYDLEVKSYLRERTKKAIG